MSIASTIQVWITALLTMVVLSAMFRENRLYRAVESYFIGLSAAVLAYYIVVDVLYRRVALPLFQGNMLYLLPLLLTIPIFFRKLPGVAKITPWVVAAGVGIYIATVMTRVFDGLIVRQLALFLPVFESGYTSWNALTSLLSAVIATAVLFHFSPFRKRALVGRFFDSIGVFSIVVALGVVLGYTIASYIALFVDRVYFLIETFLGMM